MALSNAMANAVVLSNLRTFHAVQLQLANSNVNLIDGSGTVTFTYANATTTFTGSDSTYGTLSTISSIDDSLATQAPTVNLVLLPPNNTAIAALSAPLMQGSPVNIWFGLIDVANGTVIGTPELIWAGSIDTSKTTSTHNLRSVEIQSVSVWERLFTAEEGARLNNEWHQSIWPGETGFAYCLEALVGPFWGSNIPNPLYPIHSIPASISDILSGNGAGGSYTYGNNQPGGG